MATMTVALEREITAALRAITVTMIAETIRMYGLEDFENDPTPVQGDLITEISCRFPQADQDQLYALSSNILCHHTSEALRRVAQSS